MGERREEVFIPQMDIDLGYCEEKGGICPLIHHGWRGYMYCPLHLCENCFMYRQALEEAKKYDDLED